MKRITGLLLCFCLVLSMAGSVFAEDDNPIVVEKEDSDGENKPAATDVTQLTTYICLGSDLTAEQQQQVLSLMGITADKLQYCNVSYVTNAEEHEYLDSYVDSGVIGKKSLSSVLVRPASTGSGVKVKTININYCTDVMYQNALITAGVTDAEVIVVGPSPISGTAGLIGALKAYSQISGEPVNEKALDVALDELVTTGEVKEAIGDDKAAELISYVKAQIAANDLDTEEEIEAAVRKGNEDLNANLTEEQIKQIVEVMMKIKSMGIGFDVLAEQAEEIYAKYGDQIKAGTFNIDDISLEDLGIGKMIVKSVKNFFVGCYNTVVDFFCNLFGW